RRDHAARSGLIRADEMIVTLSFPLSRDNITRFPLPARTGRNSQAHEGSATPITTLCPRPVAGSYPPPPGRPHPRVGVQPSAWPQPTKQPTRPNRLNHVSTLFHQQRRQLVTPARI